MSDLIALHWGFDDVTAVVPAKGRGAQAVALRKPDGLDSDPAAVGRWLKTQLATHRISAKRAAIVLPRPAAVFRKLTLPDLPDEELPDVVRMQAATKSPTPLDRLRLDFVPLPKRGEGREVLLATVAAKTIDETLASVRAAGLEPASVGVSPFGMAAKVAGGEPTLLIAVQGPSAEITLVRGGAVLFSHATDLPGDDPDEDRQLLSSEISRAVVAADHLDAGGGIAHVALLGPAELLKPLTATLGERYGGRAELIDDPIRLGLASDAVGVSVAALAAALGHLEPGATPRLDFLNPRKRIERPDRRRLHMAMAGAGIVAVLATAYGVSWIKQSGLDGEIATLVDRSTTLEQTLKLGQPTLDAKSAVDGWQNDHADWGRQLVALDDALPGTERAYLTKLSLAPGGRDTAGKITGQGVARTNIDVVSLNDSLAEQGYRIIPKSTVESARDPEYPFRFDLELVIPRKTSAASAATPDKAR